MAYRLIIVTCPTAKVGESIARRLVEDRIAACGNVTAPATSLYRWKGRLRRESEVLLVLKTRAALVTPCIERIRSLHPYEVPEIIALPIVAGLPEYLRWLTEETAGGYPRRGTTRNRRPSRRTRSRSTSRAR